MVIPACLLLISVIFFFFFYHFLIERDHIFFIQIFPSTSLAFFCFLLFHYFLPASSFIYLISAFCLSFLFAGGRGGGAIYVLLLAFSLSNASLFSFPDD